MTFWQWLNRNWTKVIGVTVALHAQLMSNIAQGQYNGRLDDGEVFWLAQLGTFFGVALFALGYKNTTQEKVAEAKVEVAKAMETAINSTPKEDIQ